MPPPLVLIVRDGWGENPHPAHAPFNAVHLARSRGLLPVDDRLRSTWPWTLVKTSGEDVGLPEGTMGNSEVGHQNIGAGRIVDQESVAITKACRKGLQHNNAFANACSRITPDSGSRALHFMGICSDAGVHGLLEHLYACLDAARTLGVPAQRVFIHLFTDGRDTGPFSGLDFAARVQAHCDTHRYGSIATVVGRYYAMDRDFRWERVHTAYAALTGRGSTALGVRTAPTAAHAIKAYYDNPASDNTKGDEFVTATIIGPTAQAQCDSRIKDGDSVIFYNYRGDRPRELSAAFVYPDAAWAKVKPSPDSGKHGFDRGPKLDLHFLTMTAYSEELAPYVHVAFPKPPKMTNILGHYISALGLTQFRCAETEKYPHVTFFFNDYRDEPFPGERRENPQSPKVATYDLKPQMAAEDICRAVLARLAAPDCENLLVVNFANGDMVGHTGVLEAAVTAVATVDDCVGRIIDATLKKHGSLIITADHGNCEQMFDPETNAPHTAHTVYDVPLHIISPGRPPFALRGDRDPAGWFDPVRRAARGRLADIAPTALDLMGLAVPAEMTGESLLLK